MAEQKNAGERSSMEKAWNPTHLALDKQDRYALDNAFR